MHQTRENDIEIFSTGSPGARAARAAPTARLLGQTVPKNDVNAGVGHALAFSD